jgi:hypothetical protein
MKRSMCGGFLLATLAGMLACSGDPTGDLVGASPTIESDPSSLFLAQGDTKPVTISVVDKQGNELDITGFDVVPGSGVTVVQDTTFLTTNTGAPLGTSRRLNVTGAAPGASSVTINANGTSLDIPVKVTPTSASVTVSNATPAANEPLLITLPAGYKFGAGAGASLGGAAGIVQSVAADSSSITVLLPPGGTGTITVDSVAVDFAPGVLFSLPTDNTVTVGAVTPQSGTNTPGSAPTLTLPPTDGPALAFFDGGTYDFASVNGPARLYKFVVTDSVDLTTTVDWPSPEDLGLYFYAADGATDVGAGPADAGGAGAHPESATNTFAPGTYIMGVTNFSATTPPYFGITISATTPAPAE